MADIDEIIRSTNLSNLQEMKPKADQNVESILHDVIEANFNTIIVFGYKNGEIHYSFSGCKDTLRLLGALEAAKQQVWKMS